MSYGRPGRGRHITIYANSGHAYMTVNGRRFDTSARRISGSRWTTQPRSSAGYVVRHPGRAVAAAPPRVRSVGTEPEAPLRHRG